LPSPGKTSLEKGLLILHTISEAKDGMTVSQISSALGYPESTVARMLGTLRETGYVWQDKRRGPYEIGYRVLELAGNLLESMDLRRLARSNLHDLASRTGMVTYLKVKSGGDAITIDVAVPPLASGVEHEIGRRLPMHICSPGKAILAFRGDDEVREYVRTYGLSAATAHTVVDPEAFLEDMALTRKRGYATNVEESALGTHSIAAPIMRYDGKVIAAVGLSAGVPPGILGTEGEPQLARAVIEAARQISYSLGYRAERLV